MEPTDREAMARMYSECFERFGTKPEALMVTKGRQNYEFEFLRRVDGFLPGDSVLDVGCGFGDLEPYLRGHGWTGRYCGVDITADIVEAGLHRNPALDLRLCDIQTQQDVGTFDWVFCSGTLNLTCAQNDSASHFESMVRTMFGLAEKGVAFNMLSPFADYRSENCFYPDFSALVEIVRSLSKRFSIRHDYMPYEMLVYLYKDDAILPCINIFQAHEGLFNKTKAFKK